MHQSSKNVLVSVKKIGIHLNKHKRIELSLLEDFLAVGKPRLNIQIFLYDISKLTLRYCRISATHISLYGAISMLEYELFLKAR